MLSVTCVAGSIGRLGREAAQESLQWTVSSLEESKLQLCAKQHIYLLKETWKGRSGAPAATPCLLVDCSRSPHPFVGTVWPVPTGRPALQDS